MLAANTYDGTALLPVVNRLHSRFEIGRIRVMADRGMISAVATAALEERRLPDATGTSSTRRVFVIKNAC